MKNPDLHAIANIAVTLLNESYGSCAVIDGDYLTVINAFPEGKTIEIRITEKEDNDERMSNSDKILLLRKAVMVAVTMLYESHKMDVLRTFSLDELSDISTVTSAMKEKQVEDIFAAALRETK